MDGTKLMDKDRVRRDEEERNKSKFKTTLDNMVMSLKRTFLGNNVSNTNTTSNKGRSSNYCAKYNKLAASDEIFCDEMNSSCVNQYLRAQPQEGGYLHAQPQVGQEDKQCGADLGDEMMSPGTTITCSSATTPALSSYEEDYDWDEEALTCNVCDRSFDTPRQLERHQIKRRHWGCNICEKLYNSLMELEYHKEEYQHWSDDEYDDDDDYDDDFDDENDDNGNPFHSILEEETEFGPDQEDLEMLL